MTTPRRCGSSSCRGGDSGKSSSPKSMTKDVLNMFRQRLMEAEKNLSTDWFLVQTNVTFGLRDEWRCLFSGDTR